jgi:glycosyltransferase involved in cell wall biosynthesis
MNSRKEKETHLVSVVMIFLNAEPFIEEAIQSVISQTHDHWELLLIDDGSSDASAGIARQYASQAPQKIRYLQHEGGENRGMSASRNLGTREARGEFIAFLDADDVWLPNKLTEQVALLQSQPGAAMVYGRTLRWYSWTGDPQQQRLDRPRRLGVRPGRLYHPPRLAALFLRQKALTPGTCSALIRRDAVLAVGGFEESFRGMYEDQVFFTKICLHAPAYVAEQLWDKYRQHASSASGIAAQTGEYHPKLASPAHRLYLNWMAAYLSDQGIRDPDVWKALRCALWPYRHPRLYAPFAFVRSLSSKIRLLTRRG